mmetsp:Transcript_51760/g.71838  ORF Transcript_51760/g.71838 Transcript_51760/m.71838 type:complete len:93 (+) Transcript_51760:152-430(+)
MNPIPAAFSSWMMPMLPHSGKGGPNFSSALASPPRPPFRGADLLRLSFRDFRGGDRRLESDLDGDRRRGMAQWLRLHRLRPSPASHPCGTPS